MSFLLRHPWKIGARFPALPGRAPMRLSSCAHCETLRVEHGDEPSPATTVFIRRRAIEAERIVTLEPPCVSPGAPFRAPW